MKTKFSMTGARHLAEMKNLVELEVDFIQYGLEENRKFFCNMLVFIAGCLPKLEVLRINNNRDNANLSCDFAYLYGDVFPRKKLICPNKFKFVEELRFSWPQSLQVDKIDFGPFANSRVTVRNLKRLPCPVTELKITTLEAAVVYPLLERFGSGLASLELHEEIVHFDKIRVNLARALSLCPNLEYFSFAQQLPNNSLPVPVEEFDLHALPAELFSNINSFELKGECRW